MVSPMFGVFIIGFLLSLSHLMELLTLRTSLVLKIGAVILFLFSGIPFLFLLAGFTVSGPGVGLLELTWLTVIAYLGGISIPLTFPYIGWGLVKLWKFICQKS